MCEADCNNLIDLSIDEEIPCSYNQKKNGYETQPSKEITLDSHDSMQELAIRQDDPFDIVEKEVCLKAQILKQQVEVKEENLLSLNDELVDMSTSTPTMRPERLERSKTQDLDLDSSSIMINSKLALGSESDSNPSSSAETTGSAKLRTAIEHRKRLLKLSISNNAFNSPVTRKNSLEFEDVLGTSVTTVLSKAAEFGEYSLSTESPLKLVDDNTTAEEPSSLAESEKVFEADLEMMKIPMLNDLPSPAVKSLGTNSKNSPDLVPSSKPSLETNFPNLDTIKTKLKAKREKVNNSHQQEAVSLINSLKSLIKNGDMVDETKKHASDLLESLSMALQPSKSDILKLPSEPQPVQRQGTFNLELGINEQRQEENQHLTPDIPACMISSTATYDGDSGEDKRHLNLPEIDPLTNTDNSPQTYDCHHNSKENSENNLKSDVSEILEQLSKILIVNNAGDKVQNTQNPTFIVVMNANPIVQNSSPTETTVDAKERSAFVATYLENSINDGSPDLTKVNLMPRQRSQSLSLHDKIKIVQIPFQPRELDSIQIKNAMQFDDSPPSSATPPNVDKETSEFKTPSRMIRRNSYSSGTPHTAQVGVRRTGFGSDGKHSIDQLRKAEDQHQKTVVKPVTMPSNNMPTFKPDLKRKTKNSESIMKFSGPLKATIPVKNVVPKLITSPSTPEANINSSLQRLLPKTTRVSTTPLPAKDGIRVGYPNACSTPAAFTSPLKRTTGPVNRPRYSYTSVTPNSKTVSNNASTNLKRRSITDFKAKSPLKSRVSNAGLAAAAATASTSLRSSTGSSRLTSSMTSAVSKTPVKLNSANTISVRAPGNLGSRTSFGGSGIATRNKENKRPH